MIRAPALGTRPSPPQPLLRLLLLLLLSPTVRGDCGPPPDIPNATPNLGGHPTFTEQTKVTYSCNNGFKQIPDKSNAVVCLETGNWSSYETFCNKTCSAPARVNFASLKKEYRDMNFFPIGTTVEYECRPGFRKQSSLSGRSTCLEELVWSPLSEFCKRKACPNPKELKNGHINISTDILFGSEIGFSCDPGFRLVGVASTFCSLVGNTVDWDDTFPVCTEIFCPDPPKISNGEIREESHSYVYRQLVTYSCAKGFIMVGDASIYCTVNKFEQGEWSSLPPKCIEKSKVTTKKPTVHVPSTGVPPTPQSHTTVKVPGTRVPPMSQKPTTVKVPGTRVPPMSQKPTTVKVPGTRVPPTSQKPSMVNVPDTRVSPKPQKPTKANIPSTAAPTPQKTNTAIVPATEISPTPQKANTADVPTTEIPSTPQKANTADVPTTEIPSTPQKANTADVPTTEIPSTPQKTNTAIVPATEIPSTPQKANTADVSATEIPPTPQIINTAGVPTTEIPPTPQITNIADVPTTEILPTPQKANTADIPATEVSPTPQKANTADIPTTEIPPTPQITNIAIVSATEIPPIPQKTNTADVPATEVSPTPQKTNTAKSSVTKPAPAQMSLISTTESAQTPPKTQHLTTVNSSAVQTAQPTQRFATAKPSLTLKSPATQRPTISHFSMTKGLHIVTQRFTSAHITATQHVPATKTTVRYPTITSKDKGEPNSGGDHFIYGKFDSQGVKRNCHHCGKHSPYFWKRILSYNCLRKTIKMQCLWARKGRRVNPFNRLVQWTPLGIQYAPSYSQQCSCSKVVLGQLQVIWPISQVALSARCVNMSF